MVHTIATISSDRTLLCDLDNCRKAFETKKQLYDHKFNVHKSKNFYRCPKCAASFPTPSKLARHERVHVIIKCSIDGCNVQLKNFQEKRKHMARVHPKTQCTLCNKLFSNRAALKRHERQIHVKMVPCLKPTCSKLILPRQMAKHLKVCHEECQIGDLRKSDSSAVKMSSENYNCPHCDEVFLKFQLVKKHIHRKHKTETTAATITNRQLSYCCNFSQDCERKFISKAKLESHLNWHNNYKPYKCPEVNKCFSSFCGRSSLQRHLKTIHFKRLTDYTPEQLSIDFSL